MDGITPPRRDKLHNWKSAEEYREAQACAAQIARVAEAVEAGTLTREQLRRLRHGWDELSRWNEREVAAAMRTLAVQLGDPDGLRLSEDDRIRLCREIRAVESIVMARSKCWVPDPWADPSIHLSDRIVRLADAVEFTRATVYPNLHVIETLINELLNPGAAGARGGDNDSAAAPTPARGNHTPPPERGRSTGA
jgi:hypothetical protein